MDAYIFPVKRYKFRCKNDLFDDSTFAEGRPKRLFKEGQIVDGVYCTYDGIDYVRVFTDISALVPIEDLERL